MYLNGEEVGITDGYSHHGDRRVYDGSYELTIDLVDVKKLKIGKPDKTGLEFKRLIKDQDIPFSGILRVGDTKEFNEGDIKVVSQDLNEMFPKKDYILLMKDLIYTGEEVIPNEITFELLNE